jgi:hypothetical protein
MEGRLGLADAIASLRAELYEAMGEGVDKLVRFNVGAVDLEFQVEIGREGGVSGKIRFWVVEAGADGKLSSTSTQILKIRLEPVDALTKKQLLTGETERGSQRSTKAPRPSPATA